MPVNEYGYLRPTYDELLEDRITLARELFGEDINTEENTALGKFIRLSVQDLATAYEAQEIIYYSRFPHTATGQSLDRLMPFAGISRNAATRAEHLIEFTGTAGYEIEPGFLVGTTGDEEFYLVNPVTLDENGIGSGTVQCTVLGEFGNVALGAITEIVNPSVDVTAVRHIAVETIGKETETDAELRDRFDVAIKGSGSGTSTAIQGAVMRINGVTGCLVVENATNSTDADGRPPHSFEVYVYAPDELDQEIADTIFSKKPLGIQCVGDVSVNVSDIAGATQVVKFSRVNEVVIYIKATVAVDGDFELDGVEQIQTALADYVNALSTGDDVIFASLYKYLFGVTGVRDVTALGLSTDGSAYNASNVIMGANAIARASAANILIEVTDYADR